MVHAFYLSGTDTDAGKSFAAASLLRRLAATQRRAIGMKPVASGCEWIDGRWRNADALLLQACSQPGCDYAQINPIALPAATAPEIAARLAELTIQLTPIEQAFHALAAQTDWLLVEGVGGWLAPLEQSLMQSDLVRALRLPVLLVVGLRLGCLNHALLSERAIVADQVPLLGWVGTAIDPGLAHAAAYRAQLQQRMRSPCLGFIEHGDQTGEGWNLPLLQQRLQDLAQKQTDSLY